MSSEIHLVLQGKGGVGKSVVARLLIEYMIHTGRDYLGFDVDPVNRSLAAVKGFEVRTTELLDAGEVDPRKFDALMGEIFDAADKAVIVDCGASSFLPMMGYIETADAIDMLVEEGFEVFIHTVVTGGASMDDTLTGFGQIAARFGEKCNVIPWTNPLFGAVEQDGKGFLDLPIVKKAVREDRAIGVIPVPTLHRLTQEDFAGFLASNVTFAHATAKENKAVNTMVRKRLSTIHANLMAVIGEVLDETPAPVADAG